MPRFCLAIHYLNQRCACLLSLCTTCKYTPLLLQLHLCCRKSLLNHRKEITYVSSDPTSITIPMIVWQKLFCKLNFRICLCLSSKFRKCLRFIIVYPAGSIMIIKCSGLKMRYVDLSCKKKKHFTLFNWFFRNIFALALFEYFLHLIARKGSFYPRSRSHFILMSIENKFLKTLVYLWYWEFMLTIPDICETCLCKAISRNDSLGCSSLKT